MQTNLKGFSLIEGNTPINLASGPFAIPAGFPVETMSAKWVEDGMGVQEARQPETLAFVGLRAEGWELYKVVDTEAMNLEKIRLAEEAEKETSGDKKLAPTKPKSVQPMFKNFTRVVGKRLFVLMMRSKQLQQSINIIYANQSRELVTRELQGDTSQVMGEDRGGILTNRDLTKMVGREDSKGAPTEEEAYLKQTPMPDPSEADTLRV